MTLESAVAVHCESVTQKHGNKQQRKQTTLRHEALTFVTFCRKGLKGKEYSGRKNSSPERNCPIALKFAPEGKYQLVVFATVWSRHRFDVTMNHTPFVDVCYSFGNILS